MTTEAKAKSLGDYTNRQLATYRRKLEKQWDKEPDEDRAREIRCEIDKVMEVRNSRLTHLTSPETMWSGEIKVRFKAGFTNTYYPRTYGSARRMHECYSESSEVSGIRVLGPSLTERR